MIPARGRGAPPRAPPAAAAEAAEPPTAARPPGEDSTCTDSDGRTPIPSSTPTVAENEALPLLLLLLPLLLDAAPSSPAHVSTVMGASATEPERGEAEKGRQSSTVRAL